jgi:hypothetical protein
MKTIFAKYNYERLPKYQIVTKIVEDKDGTRHAKKELLCIKAKEHIETIYKNYDLLKSTYDTNLVKPTRVENGLLFEMAEGKSLENIFLECLDSNDKSKFQKYINKYLDFVDTMVTKQNVIFSPSKEFKSIFGNWEITEPQDIIKVANIDMIFSNIFVNEKDEFTLIDYEWVFDFEIPKSYVIWRSFAIFSMYHQVILSKIIDNTWDTNNEEYLKLDSSFGNMVHGYNKRYFLNTKTLKHFSTLEYIQKENKTNTELWQRVNQTESQLKESNKTNTELWQRVNQTENQLNNMTLMQFVKRYMKND